MATAHKLARLVASLPRHGTAYMTQGMEDYERAYREEVVKGLSRRDKELGYNVCPHSGAVDAAPECGLA